MKMSRGIYERFNSATETSEEEDKELITFDGNYIRVFYEKDPKVIGWNTTMKKKSFSLSTEVKIPDVIDWNATDSSDLYSIQAHPDDDDCIQDLAAADSCDLPSSEPKTDHLSIANCEHIDSMTTSVPREGKVMTTDGVTVSGIIDCWISADETTGERLLSKFKGEKPKTNVRSLFFELNFWTLFSNWYRKTTNH